MVSTACLLLLTVTGSADNKKHTNIVFFLVDDLGWPDVACYGSTFHETPNIDRLAAEGMLFTDGYAASPICSPTRSSILTGKYPGRTENTQYFGGPQPNERYKGNTLLLPAQYKSVMELEEQTLAETLKQHGYATFYAGKWHLGHEGFWPEDQGFDINKGGTHKGGPYGGNKYFSPYYNPRLEDGPDGEHLPDRLATETVKFMKGHRDQPFLAYFSFYSVHAPRMAPKGLEEKYRNKPKPPEKWATEGKIKVHQAQTHAVYAGMVEAMDRAVGKVLDGLKELGLAENTIVVFTSDNGGVSTGGGWAASNYPLRTGKGWLYEGGIREPYIIRAPGVTQPGTVCSVPVTSTDFYPTLLDLCGLPLVPEQHMDGVSIVPLLKGADSLEREAIYWHYPHYSGGLGGRPSAAIRQGKWKLIEFFEDRRVELYNVAEDSEEQLEQSEAQPEITAKLLKNLKDWYVEIDATFPTPNKNYKQPASAIGGE